MDVPDQGDLQDDGDEDDEQDGEEDGLVVEDGDGLGRRADGEEPVELTHFGFLWSFGFSWVGTYRRGATSERWVFFYCLSEDVPDVFLGGIRRERFGLRCGTTLSGLRGDEKNGNRD